MLTLKHLPITSFNENLAYLNRECIAYKVDDINQLTKIEIHGGLKTVYAFLQIVDDSRLVKPNEIALNTEAFEMTNLPEGAKVSITLSAPPPSLNSIKRKIAGNILSSSEYSAIINDISAKRYSNMDIASFLVASGSFMSAPEVLSLTEAMVGERVINWENETIVVDHHCLGGVPGNKTDLIITPIVAAYGLPVPKTASHSLTSCAGVADTMSVLANVDFDEETLTTINKFFENSLNVSETSRQLYIHRNTLVYRLDKLQKSTGLDLRVFEDAITFKIALMVVKYMKYMETLDY